jgi:hypothetical protein
MAIRYFPALVFCAYAAALSAQVQSGPESLVAQISASEAHVTVARPHTILEAEAEGATYPHVTSTRPVDGPARTCVTIRPDQILFPSTRGDANAYRLRSGDFDAPSISFGWGDTYEQAKMPLRPLHPGVIGVGLWIRLIRLDPPGEGPTFALDNLNRPDPFFPSWPRFPTPGKWMMLLTAGANWGCFVLDRPVKPLTESAQ